MRVLLIEDDLGKLYDHDIILLDLNLPDMSGFEVLRALRVSKVKTPILILSGLADMEDKVKGLGISADDYLTKPFHKDELIARRAVEPAQRHDAHQGHVSQPPLWRDGRAGAKDYRRIHLQAAQEAA
jgi:DNA-binding response OmpR family regulator